MTRLVQIISTLMVVLLLTAPASAACVAEYKAKRDNPLRLDHGVLVVPGTDCTRSEVQAAVSEALAAQGWKLLNIVSVQRAE